MYTITGYLYKNNKLLLRGMKEDLENFVEELKILNPKFVDIKEFKILNNEDYVLKKWNSR
ncbi:MAG: hypothetical protein IKE89_03575 [Bacilli bacterium]|nr:hypothetical protein [Bacilli bacterium]